jgi:hypothetical protein
MIIRQERQVGKGWPFPISEKKTLRRIAGLLVLVLVNAGKTYHKEIHNAKQWA